MKITASKSGERGGIVLILLQRRREHARRGLHVTLLQRFLGLGKHGSEIGLGVLAQDAIDKSADRAFGLGAFKAVERTSVAEGIDGRQSLDLQLPRDGGVLINIDLHQANFAAVTRDDFLQQRSELLARRAPRHPEIDKHRHVAGGLDHIFGETRCGRALNKLGVCCPLKHPKIHLRHIPVVLPQLTVAG